jgi:uncharacterized membrane protein
MIPLLVLVVFSLIFYAMGLVGVSAFADPFACLRYALTIMFLVTASAHWGKRRPDLVRMVPPAFPRPDLLVTATGVLEVLGSVGLILRQTSRLSAICLTILLVALFPANAYAAKRNLTLGGRAVPSLKVRLPLQLFFIFCLVVTTLN